MLWATPAWAQGLVRIMAAGSLADAFADLLTAFGAPAGSIASPVFGPSGSLRQRIEAGQAILARDGFTPVAQAAD